MISPENLRRYPIFGGASEESLKVLAMVSVERSFSAGETMFIDDEPAYELFILTSGEVDISYMLNTGEERTVDTLVTGDVLVWSALIEPFRTTAHGVARKDSTVISVDAPTLRKLCDADLALGYRVMSELARVTSHRLQGARVQLATIG